MIAFFIQFESSALKLPATAVTLSSGPEGLAAKNGLNFGGLTFDGTQVICGFCERSARELAHFFIDNLR
jgi:hypothetical protein